MVNQRQFTYKTVADGYVFHLIENLQSPLTTILKVQTGDQTASMEFKPVSDSFPAAATAPQLALASLCKLVLNLNEFVYVD